MMGNISSIWWLVAGAVGAALAILGIKYVSKGKTKLPVNGDRIDKQQAEVREDEAKELGDINKRKEKLNDASNDLDEDSKLDKLADLVNKD